MSSNAALVYTPRFLDYKVPSTHPFNPVRFALAADLMRSLGVLVEGDVVAPRAAELEELIPVHSPSYIDMVRRSSEAGQAAKGAELFGLGSEDNPVFAGLHEAASLICGATLTCADLVMSGEYRHALNLAGGLHHAQRAKASGFCVYNDAAVTIAHLQQVYGAKVAYIDIDAHHGDGVQFAFYDDPEVLTVSLHETGRFLFPGTGDVNERGLQYGYGYSVNLPLEPFTEDDSFLDCLTTAVVPLIRAFSPDVILTQNGCDGHRDDVMSDLALSTRAFTGAARLFHDLAHEVCDGRWIATGGGGYEVWGVAPRVWTLLWAEMSGREAADHIPPAWRDLWAAQSPIALPQTLRDPVHLQTPMPRRAEINEKNRQTAQRAIAGSFAASERRYSPW